MRVAMHVRCYACALLCMRVTMRYALLCLDRRSGHLKTMNVFNRFLGIGRPTPVQPSLKETKKRKSVEIATVKEVAHSYHCNGCGKVVSLTPSQEVKCSHCDYRILAKIRTVTHITYSAV